MNALNMIPVVGWFIAAVICIFVAIPVWLLWNWLAPVYAFQLPDVYLHIPYWHTVGLIWLITSLKGIFLRSSTVTQTNKTSKED